MLLWMNIKLLSALPRPAGPDSVVRQDPAGGQLRDSKGMQSLWRDAGAEPLPGSTEGGEPSNRNCETHDGRSGGPFARC